MSTMHVQALSCSNFLLGQTYTIDWPRAAYHVDSGICFVLGGCCWVDSRGSRSGALKGAFQSSLACLHAWPALSRVL
jgi:hypothetical protein